MVKRLRVEEESAENKVKRLCNKLRGDAREVSHHELEEVANAVEEIRRRLAAPFTIQELIAAAPDSALNSMVENQREKLLGGSKSRIPYENSLRELLPELRGIEECISILQDAYSHLHTKVSIAYAEEFNRLGKYKTAEINNVAFRQAVEGQLKMRERQRLMDEARTAAHQLAHELAQKMVLNSKQQDIEMSN
jgi:hypothetical protein